MATDKQERFVTEYLRCFNATEAAIAAGYSPRTARVQGSRLLTNADIRAAIEKAQDAARGDAAMEHAEAIKLLSACARVNIANFVRDDGTLDIPALKAAHPKAVESVRVRQGADGATTVEVRFPSKVAVIERLAKLLGWDRPEVIQQDIEVRILAPDDLDKPEASGDLPHEGNDTASA